MRTFESGIGSSGFIFWWRQGTQGYRGLLRAADFAVQLDDPNRLQKCMAIFDEFEEIGLNARGGYKRPGDLRIGNTELHWDVVSL